MIKILGKTFGTILLVAGVGVQIILMNFTEGLGLSVPIAILFVGAIICVQILGLHLLERDYE